MAQSLLKISTDTLRLEVYKLTISQIKRLIEQIYEHKRSSIGNSLIYDLERKETVLEGEMIRRGYLKHKRRPGDLQDYNNWKFKKQFKKRIF